MKYYKVVVMQDEQLKSWQYQKGMSKVVQNSCMGMMEARLKNMENVIFLDSSIPTTKLCPLCGTEHKLSLNDR